MITVVMPVTRPHDDYFRDAIESVLEQTSPRWELIVVTEPHELAGIDALVSQWADDARVRVVANEGRRLAGAINTGMRQASTEFVALLLADDRWHPSAVETLLWHIDHHPQIDFWHSGRQIIDDDGRPISSVHLPPDTVSLSDFEVGTPVKHLLCWRRTKGLSAGGLDERSRSVGPDDLDFPWTMAEQGAQFGAVRSGLYLYRDHRRAERLTTDIPLSVHLRELRRIFRKHDLDRATTQLRLRDAEATYLRQCLYRTSLSRAVRRRLTLLPPKVWRDTYR